jgi:hypothetical protein
MSVIHHTGVRMFDDEWPLAALVSAAASGKYYDKINQHNNE